MRINRKQNHRKHPSIERERAKLAAKWGKTYTSRNVVEEAISEMNNYVYTFNRAHIIKDEVRRKIL